MMNYQNRDLKKLIISVINVIGFLLLCFRELTYPIQITTLKNQYQVRSVKVSVNF